MRLANRTVLLVTVFLGIQAWAQTPNIGGVTTQADPFAHVQEALIKAADNTLAATAQHLPDPEGTTAHRERSEAAEALNVSLLPAPFLRPWLRVEQLRPVIEPILREEAVPSELIAVVLIESGGQPMALSPKGARGLWQFMPGTARRYGLAVDTGTDERLDVQKSTRAAARYLRDLYQRFGSWTLALAAYNAGEGAVDAASGKAHSTDFALVGSWLPLETRNYVPTVLGVMGRLPAWPTGRPMAGRDWKR